MAAGGERVPRGQWRVKRGGYKRDERRQGLGEQRDFQRDEGRENEDENGVRVERLPQQRRRDAPPVRRRHQK